MKKARVNIVPKRKKKVLRQNDSLQCKYDIWGRRGDKKGEGKGIKDKGRSGTLAESARAWSQGRGFDLRDGSIRQSGRGDLNLRGPNQQQEQLRSEDKKNKNRWFWAKTWP